MIILPLILELLKKTKVKRRLLYTIISFLMIFCIIISLQEFVENKYLKFSKVEDSFFYSFPRANILKKYESKDYAFIIYEEEGDSFNHYDAIHYLKNDDYWNILSSNSIDQTKRENYSDVRFGDDNYDIKTLSISYNKIDEYDKTVILIISNMNISLEEITDTFNSKFEKMNVRKEYIYFSLIDGKVSNNYEIKIKDKEYTLNF